MIGVLLLTHDTIQDAQLSATDQWVITTQKDACGLVFEQLEAFIYNSRFQQLSFGGVAAIESKILEQVERLSGFIEVLQGCVSFPSFPSRLGEIPVMYP